MCEGDRKGTVNTYGVPLREMECFQITLWWWLDSPTDILRTIHLYTWNEWLICYMNDISMILFLKCLCNQDFEHAPFGTYSNAIL